MILRHIIPNITPKDNFIGQLSEIQSAQDINVGLSKKSISVL
jgi:hypothetical protein